jgi:hypothetical protein
MEGDDWEKLAELRSVLGIESELPFTVIQYAIARIKRLRSETGPVDMILHCPACHLQHVDAPDERTPDWKNEPHRSHLCHGCGFIWRPADVPTNGVKAIATKGEADSGAEVGDVPNGRSTVANIGGLTGSPMREALEFMLAYENDAAAAMDEIQEAFSQQRTVKDAQEFARCYCARKMRAALDTQHAGTEGINVVPDLASGNLIQTKGFES